VAGRRASGRCGRLRCVLGVSWRSWLAVTAMRRPGREAFVGKCRETSRFRPELHTSVTLLHHPQVDGPKTTPIGLLFGPSTFGVRRKAHEAWGTCAEVWSSWGLPHVSPHGVAVSPLVSYPAVSGTVTACQGRDRDGRARRHPLRPLLGREAQSSPPRATFPPPAPGSSAGPLGEAMPRTRIAFRPKPSFSRPSVEETSWPQSSRTRSRR